MSVSLPEFRNGWTLADLESLPEDGNRYELVDGCLLVTPGPTQRHQRSANALRRVLEPHLPPGWEASTEFTLPFAIDTQRIPDLAVYRWPPLEPRADDRSPVGPADVGLILEVVSPSTRRTDRFAKPGEYADAGIAVYWRLETEPDLVLHTFVLDGSTYRAAAVITTSGAAPTPWGEVQVDLALLQV